MKNLVLVIPANVYQSVTDKLRELSIPGFTLAHVEGHGAHTARDTFMSAHDRVVGFVPRVRIDVVLPEEAVDEVVAALTDTGSELAAHGAWWVSPVDRFGGF
jgi:nitrogen regulatory protein P-II 1